jgi:hypothetical protein
MWIMWISSCITRLFRSFLLAEVWINGVENNFRWPDGRASGGLILCSFKVEGHFLKTKGNVARHNLQQLSDNNSAFSAHQPADG